LKRISSSPTEAQGNDASFGIAPVSHEGSFVAFTSDASNLVVNDDDNNETDIFLAELNLNAEPDTQPSSIPALYVIQTGLTWIELSWEPAYNNVMVTNYTIYRSDNEGDSFTKIANLDGPSYQYLDTELQPKSQYYYYVLAGDDDGNYSSIPSPVQATTNTETTYVP